MPQSQTAALPRLQEEEETDKTKQAQIKQTYQVRDIFFTLSFLEKIWLELNPERT